LAFSWNLMVIYLSSLLQLLSALHKISFLIKMAAHRKTGLWKKIAAVTTVSWGLLSNLWLTADMKETDGYDVNIAIPIHCWSTVDDECSGLLVDQ